MNKDYTYLDVEVIKKFQKGDPQAFEEVYKKYQSHIYRMAYQFTKNTENASDIVQETFLKAYQYKEKLKAPEAFFTWISKIAYGKCIDHYQKRKKDAVHYANDYEDGFPEERFEDQRQMQVLDQIQIDSAKEIILSTLDDMNADWKLTGYLRFFEELSIKEIAEVMDVPSGTVLSRLSRIRLVLKKKLEEQNFTKETCFSALLVPNMIDFCQSSNRMKVTMPLEQNRKTWKEIKKRKSQPKSVNSGISFINILLVSVVLLPVGVASLKSKDILPNLKGSKQLAEITNVDYLQELTNQPLKIAVETTNNNYDEIELNGKNQTMVTKNGEYILTLIKDNKVIDKKKIIISNVDMDMPIVVEEIVEEDRVILRLEDTDTEIDFSKVAAYENDVKLPIEIDEVNKKVTIKKVENMNSILEVPDIVGNVLKVTINFYKFQE